MRNAEQGERVTVVVCASGHRNYLRAAREAIRSVLARSPFDVIACVDRACGRLRLRSGRLRVLPLTLPPAAWGRAGPFLACLTSLQLALEASDTPLLMLLDADAVLVQPTQAGDVRMALGGRTLGMVEQTCIRGGDMTRERLRAFAFDVMVPFFGPRPAGIQAQDLVYYNSGVVLGEREAFEELATWALAHMERSGAGHDRGEHMVGDQDYVQYWVNVLQRGSCATLPWSWNHCEHWDAEFPRADARIVHFSNFCHGPRRSTLRTMRAARRGGVARLRDVLERRRGRSA